MSEVGTAQRDNAVPEVSYYKDEYTITSGLILTVNHGLPKRPRQIFLKLKNKVAELGYAVNDEVELTASASVSIAANSTQLKVVFATLPSIVNFSTNAVTAITNTSWNLVIKAEV